MELAERAHCGDLDGVKTLIQQHVDVNMMNSSNQTALYIACVKGHTEIVQYLLDNGASVSLGAKPLIAAVRYSRYNCVKLLLQYHADANCTNAQGESPMSVALQKYHFSIILLLVHYGAIPSESLDDIAVLLLKRAKAEHATAIQKLIDRNFIKFTSGSRFLAVFGFAFKRGSLELAERMLWNESYWYSKMEQLYPDAAYYSAKNNWPTVLSKLFEKRVDINILTDGKSPLYIACEEGHENVVKLLLNNGADPNVPNEAGVLKALSSPLQITVQHGNVVIFDMLLENGAKMNPPGEPLLHIACTDAAELKPGRRDAGDTRSMEYMLSIIGTLLQQGVNVNAISDKGDTALYRACKSQQLKIVQILLEAGADVNLTSKRHYPVIAACEAGKVELISLLVKAGADVKCSNSNNETCLYAIAGSQRPADSVSIVNFIKSLLEARLDVNAYCSQGETALFRASKAGHEHVVRLLLEAGAETNGFNSRLPLYAACEQGHTQIVDQLLHHGADPNASSGPRIPAQVQASSRSLPICCAVQKGYTDIINLLLEHGADVNKQDQSGKSALIIFLELMSQRYQTPQHLKPVEEKDLNILRSMLLLGADVNTLSESSGRNALHIASSSGMCDVMMELIQHGANCKCLTSSGESALELACENGQEVAVELLLKNGAKPDRKTISSNRSGRISYAFYYSYLSSTPVLCAAVKSGNETIVKMLLKHGADVNESDMKGNTALHMATSNAVIETLLNAGANVNSRNYNGETAFSIVCEKQQADANVVETLLRFNADPNTRFPLYAACKNNDTDTVRLLMAYGANTNLVKESIAQRLIIDDTCTETFARVMHVNVIEPSPLCLACKNENKVIVECLLVNGALVSFVDHDGNTPLHFAVDRKQANSEEYDPIVTLLLQHGAPVNVVSSIGETPLYVACSKGLTAIVKQLLDCKADVALTTRNYKKYPLMIACEREFRDIATMLLDRGADANVNKNQQTPLKLASANGDAVLVKQLLKGGADVNQMKRISDTALHVAMIPRRGIANEAFANVVQKLLKSGAEPNAHNCKGETPLCLACRPTNGEVNVGIVQILLEHGADSNKSPPHAMSSWSRDYLLPPSPLSLAAICGNNELTMLLIKFGARIDHSDNRGRTALHFAVGHDNVTWCYDLRHMEATKSGPDMSTTELLLSAGADVNAMDNTGVSPLYLACDGGKTEFVKLLLSHGANPNIVTADKYPLHAACRGQYYDAVTVLLEYNADVAVRDGRGKTALHFTVESDTHHSTDSDTGNVLVQLLLDRGANINSVSENGETPFYIACSRGLMPTVKKMLQYGAKVDGNSGKKLPLHVACRNKHVSVVRLLLTNGANPNVQEEDDKDRYWRPKRLQLPLHIAADGGNSELVELLLKHDAIIDVADSDGNTVLHHTLEHYYYHQGPTSWRDSEDSVSSCNEKSVIDILLENKADVNVLNSSGETPLYRAVSRGLVDVVSKMLQVCGVDPNKGSPDKSPLVAACLTQNVELVETLLQHGADPNVAQMSCDSDSKCAFPLCIAAEKGDSDIVMLLLKAGANVNATNQGGKSALYLTAETLTGSCYYQSTEVIRKQLSTIRVLLHSGANFNKLMPDGRSPLHLAVTALSEAHRREDWCKTGIAELLQLMVQHGAMLLDSSCHIWRQSLHSGTLVALANFDGRHEFIVDFFRAGAGFYLLAFCCNAVAVATSPLEKKSITLCQAAVLAGYSPSAEELQHVQFAAANRNATGHLMEQLMNWLNEDRQQVPSLLRLSRVAIRQQLSVVVHFQTILPAIDKLPLPTNLKLYLQFDGTMTEVDLSTVNKFSLNAEIVPDQTINKELQTREMPEGTSVENRRQLLSPYHSDYSDNDICDYVDDYGYDSDSDGWW